MLRKPLFYLSLVILWGCHSNNKGPESNSQSPKDSNLSKTVKTPDTAKVAKQNDTAHLSVIDSEEVDPDTAFSIHALKVISQFPEIQLADKYIDSVTSGKRGVMIAIRGLPTKDEPYYDIGAGDDIPDSLMEHFDAYMHFHVYNKHEQPIIKYYSIIADSEYTLKDWRRRENVVKLKGNKYYFFYCDTAR